LSLSLIFPLACTRSARRPRATSCWRPKWAHCARPSRCSRWRRRATSFVCGSRIERLSIGWRRGRRRFARRAQRHCCAFRCTLSRAASVAVECHVTDAHAARSVARARHVPRRFARRSASRRFIDAAVLVGRAWQPADAHLQSVRQQGPQRARAAHERRRHSRHACRRATRRRGRPGSPPCRPLSRNASSGGNVWHIPARSDVVVGYLNVQVQHRQPLCRLCRRAAHQLGHWIVLPVSVAGVNDGVHVSPSAFAFGVARRAGRASSAPRCACVNGCAQTSADCHQRARRRRPTRRVPGRRDQRLGVRWCCATARSGCWRA
jgi:hypothetical protein